MSSIRNLIKRTCGANWKPQEKFSIQILRETKGTRGVTKTIGWAVLQWVLDESKVWSQGNWKNSFECKIKTKWEVLYAWW